MLVIFKWLLNLLKCLIYQIIKDKKVCLGHAWIRLTTAYLLCAREFRQNNALALQFWCLSNALTLRVCALDTSKSQRACIILSKFTHKSKYAVINLSFTFRNTKFKDAANGEFRKWISQSQFSYHPLRMKKGISKIFDSKTCCWTVSSYFWCLLPTRMKTFIPKNDLSFVFILSCNK